MRAVRYSFSTKSCLSSCGFGLLLQNPTDESKGLHVGGSVINTASFVGKMGAATPQIACELIVDQELFCFSVTMTF